jgi:uncharacterized protein YbaR (Trm112 family)
MSHKESIPNHETPLISDDLLKMIVCPVSGCALELEGNELISRKACVSYEIIDGIPILVAKEDEKNCPALPEAKYRRQEAQERSKKH